MSNATFGTANEDNAHLSKTDSKTVRRRSLALLATLIRPVRLRFWLTIAMVVLSQAARTAPARDGSATPARRASVAVPPGCHSC